MNAASTVLWIPEADADLAGWLVFFGAIVILTLVIIPILLFGLELILLGVALALLVLERTLTRKPWTVFAVSVDRPDDVWEWQTRGWKNSRAVLKAVRARLNDDQDLSAGVSGARLVRAPVVLAEDGS